MTWSTAHLSVSGHPWDLNVQLAALSLASANLILKPSLQALYLVLPVYIVQGKKK